MDGCRPASRLDRPAAVGDRVRRRVGPSRARIAVGARAAGLAPRCFARAGPEARPPPRPPRRDQIPLCKARFPAFTGNPPSGGPRNRTWRCGFGDHRVTDTPVPRGARIVGARRRRERSAGRAGPLGRAAASGRRRAGLDALKHRLRAAEVARSPSTRLCKCTLSFPSSDPWADARRPDPRSGRAPHPSAARAPLAAPRSPAPDRRMASS